MIHIADLLTETCFRLVRLTVCVLHTIASLLMFWLSTARTDARTTTARSPVHEQKTGPLSVAEIGVSLEKGETYKS